MLWEEIVSNAVKEHWNNIGFVPSDEMKVMLISTAPWKFDKEQKAFEEIRDNTEDVTLKGRLSELLEHCKRAIEDFKKNDDPQILYRVDFYEFGKWEDVTESELFTEYDLCYQYALDYLKEYDLTCSFEIVKTRFFSSKQDPDDMHYSEDNISFDGGGKIENIYGIIGGYPDWFHDTKDFVEKWYDIPHPFKIGDILVKTKLFEEEFRDEDKGKYVYIAETVEPSSLKGDISDVGIWVDSVDVESGRFYDIDNPEKPYTFEYADIDLETYPWDAPLRVILSCISSMLKEGKVGMSLQTFQDAMRCIRERAEEAHKTKCYCSEMKLRNPYYRWPKS